MRRRAFRPDLFYRLNVVHIRVPPLRERPGGVSPLAKVFLKTFARKHGRPASRLAAEDAALLTNYEWPGNVGELSHVLERAVIVADGVEVTAEDLPAPLRASAASAASGRRRPTLAEVEAGYIAETLRAAGGNKSGAARPLGISRKSLYERPARKEGMKDEG